MAKSQVEFVTLPPERLTLLAEWRVVSALLKTTSLIELARLLPAVQSKFPWYGAMTFPEMIEREMTLRRGLVFAMQTSAEGTKHVQANDDWKAKCVRSQNYSLTNEYGETETALSKIEEKYGPAAVAGLVSWKPALSKDVFRRLPEDGQNMLVDALTITDGTPTMELKSAPTVESIVGIIEAGAIQQGWSQ